MIPNQQEQSSPTPDQIMEIIDQVNTQWVDQYNHHLLLTVQALQALQAAFDRKFTR